MPTDCTNLSPGISIVIVSANENQRLLSTLSSIPSDVQNLEIILVVPKFDNRVMDIVRMTNHQKIKIFNDSGLGVYQAMNIGTSKARFTHVLFLNTGDLIVGSHPLKSCLSEIEKKPNTSFVLPIEAKWNSVLNDSLPDLRSFIAGDTGSYVSHQGVLFLTSFVKQEGRFDERFKIAADFKQLCSLYCNQNYTTLTVTLVSIEYPNISSKFNRRGRLESIIVALFNLQGLLRIRATANRLQTEIRNRR